MNKLFNDLFNGPLTKESNEPNLGRFDAALNKIKTLLEPLAKASGQGVRKTHKYVKRTGGPGNYKYWYKMPNGKMYSSETPLVKPKMPKDKSKKTVTVVKVKNPKKMVTVKTKTGDGQTSTAQNDAKMAVGQALFGTFQPQQSQSTYAPHMQKDAPDVFNKLLKRQWSKTIEDGVGGVKGIIESGGKSYFVKSEAGNDLENLWGQTFPSDFSMTRNETTYSDVVHTNFSDMSDYFIKKHKLNDTTFMADAINIGLCGKDAIDAMKAKKDPYLQNDLAKLGIINYVLGNADRHGTNMTIDASTGKLKLFDEGFAIGQQNNIETKVPTYTQAINDYIDYGLMLEYFGDEKKHRSASDMVRSTHGHEAAQQLDQRWSAMNKLLQHAHSHDMVSGDFFKRLYKTDAYILDEGFDQIDMETIKND